MRKGLNIASLAGAVSLAMSGAAIAAGPTTAVQFGHTTDGSGNVSANYCGNANVNCQVIATGTGFAQIQVTDITDVNAPQTYIHTIVDDANQGFVDETFVRVEISNGGTATTNANGLMGQQTITQADFDSTTNVNTGWANAGGATDPTITIVQTLADAGAAAVGDEFDSFFGYKAITDDTGNRTAFSMDISQNAGLYQPSTGSGVNGDVQSFALRERSGDFNLTNSTAADAITWSSTDDIKAIWLGQDVALPETNQTNRADMARSYFGFVAYENVTNTADGVDAGEYSSASDIGGLYVDGPGADWNAVFNGTAADGTTLTTPTLGNP